MGTFTIIVTISDKNRKNCENNVKWDARASRNVAVVGSSVTDPVGRWTAS